MEICQVCGQAGEDRRTLHVACLYELREVSDKFTAPTKKDYPGLYTLRMCKDCRGDLLNLLRQWARGDRIQEEATIPVRLDGRNVMITDEEYAKYRQKGGD